MRHWLKKGVEVKRAPACGTIGCVAGWVVLLHDPATYNRRKTITVESPDNVIANEAERLLGVDEDGLFLGVTQSKPQTRAHVEEIVDRIRLFQGRHEAALKAKRV